MYLQTLIKYEREYNKMFHYCGADTYTAISLSLLLPYFWVLSSLSLFGSYSLLSFL